MTATSWGPAELADAIRRSCAAVRDARAELTALDAAAGDGDLGESLAIGVAAIERDLDDPQPADIGDVLRRTGTALSTAAPSTFGTLLGMSLRDAGRALADRAELAPADLARMLEAMAAGVQRRGEVQAGQRTVLDALLGSCAELERAAPAGTSAAMQAVARGAQAGAAATASMRAQVGRAGWIGERAEGRPDAGAQAWAVIATGLAGPPDCPGNAPPSEQPQGSQSAE